MLIRLAVRSFGTRVTVMGKMLTAETPSMEVSSTALLNTLRMSGDNSTSDIEDLKAYLSRGLIEVFEGSKQIRTLDDFDGFINEGPSTALLSTEFVFCPKDPAGAHDNVYIDWETLYADAKNITAPKRIFFDFQYSTRVIIIFRPPPELPRSSRLPPVSEVEDPSILAPAREPDALNIIWPPPRRRYLSDIVLPAGNWDFGMDTELIGSAPLSVPDPQLVLSEGCQFSGVTSVRDLPMYSASSQPIFVMKTFYPSDSAKLRLMGTTFFSPAESLIVIPAPFIQWSGSGGLTLDMFDDAMLLGGGMIQSLFGNIFVRMFDAAYVDANAILLSGGGASLNVFSTCVAYGAQDPGVSVALMGDPASLMFYSGSPDWETSTPTNILEAVNRLASAVAALRGTPIP